MGHSASPSSASNAAALAGFSPLISQRGQEENRGNSLPPSYPPSVLSAATTPMLGGHGKHRAASHGPGSKATSLLFVALVATLQLVGGAAAAASAPKAGVAARALMTSSEDPCPILLTACSTNEECEECVASVAAAVEACAADPTTTASSGTVDTCDDTAAICCGLEADGGACLANTWFKDYIECVALAGDCATVIDEDCATPTPSPTSGASGSFVDVSRGAASYLFCFAAAVGLLATALGVVV